VFDEPTADGREIRLRIREPARFIGAAFLLVWLCMWAAGESFALWILIRGALALATRTPLAPDRAPLQVGLAVLIGVFLLVWLAIWTLGGVAAIGEFLRLMWGEDRIDVESGRLRVRWMRGPFRRGRTFERDAIHRISLSSPHEYLVLESGARRIELSRLGAREERRRAAETMNAMLSISHPADSGALPEPWQDIITPEGEHAVVANLITRRRQALFTTVLAMLGATVTFLVAGDVPHQPALATPAVVGLALTVLLVWGALWLARGRIEWRIGSGGLTLRRRYGASVRDMFEGRRLLLVASTDSDGDLWYELFAVGDPPPASPSPPPRRTAWKPQRPPNSRSIARLMNQPEIMRGLASWLAMHAQLPLEDRTTPKAQALELAQLLAVLEQSGRFGRWASKLIDRLAKAKKA